MKILLTLLVIGVLLLGGCSGKDVEERMDAVGDKVEDGLNKMMGSSATVQEISRQEAIDIALRHAGATEDKVSGLRTEYEVDDGVGHYDVRFLLDGQEYDCEIAAADGKVLSFEVDG